MKVLIATDCSPAADLVLAEVAARPWPRQKVEAAHKMPIGEPRALILDVAEAWEADLIVVAAHGRRGLDRLLMGSVSEAVATYAPCSVEVIRN
jgi:nucleotide-binding universal stress UspA family protein